MAVTFQPQNPSFRKSHWLLRLFGWLVLIMPCAAGIVCLCFIWLFF
jgi:hypothetical protein